MLSVVWHKTWNQGPGLIGALFAPLAIFICLLMVVAFGLFGVNIWVIIIGMTLITLAIILRQDALAITLIIAAHLYVDWYLVLHVVGLTLAVALLFIFYLTRSSARPWIGKPHALRLWLLFLVLTVIPAINGALTLHDTLNEYPNIVFAALIMFWLGALIARDTASVRRLFKMLAVLGALLAMHTIIQALTGVTVFGSASVNAYLSNTLNYNVVYGLDIHRYGSFFADPNWNGAFFATVLFIPLGLFVECRSFFGKLFYLAETLIMLPALLFTYSTGAWIAAAGGLIAFIVFVGRTRYRVQLTVCLAVAVLVLVSWFPTQIALQLQRASNSDETALRVATWQTGVAVIEAFPLTGVGLGGQAYLRRSEPYRVAAQYVPLDHPHNSYLELGAEAGLPVLIVFIAILVYTSWQALRNWIVADARTRSLLGGGLAAVIALSVNSVSINGWTLPPLAAIGWIILGAISSPLLAKSLASGIVQVEKGGI